MKSWIEISGARLAANLHAIRSVAGPETEVLAVVKANGYGHDAAVASSALVAAGVRWLGVSDVEEGTHVRQAVGPGVDPVGGPVVDPAPRILVMCGMEEADAPGFVAANLTPVVWTHDHLSAIELAAIAAGTRVSVHLEVDTGMTRQGVLPGPALDEILTRLAASRWIALEGVMSHLASSEVAHSAQTRLQQERFAAALAQVQAHDLRPAFVHLANTSALDEAATLAFTRSCAHSVGARLMVRTGLAVFGYCLPLEDASVMAAGPPPGALASQLLPALTWKTSIVGLRDVPAGATVGYGATFIAPCPMRLALLPVGYADGYRREASSGLGLNESKGGWVMIANQRAAVVGRVSMNLTVVDVTGLANIYLGDEAVLLGEGVTAHDHALWCGTIPYEVLCGIRAHVRLTYAR